MNIMQYFREDMPWKKNFKILEAFVKKKQSEDKKNWVLVVWASLLHLHFPLFTLSLLSTKRSHQPVERRVV